MGRRTHRCSDRGCRWDAVQRRRSCVEFDAGYEHNKHRHILCDKTRITISQHCSGYWCIAVSEEPSSVWIPRYLAKIWIKWPCNNTQQRNEDLQSGYGHQHEDSNRSVDRRIWQDHLQNSSEWTIGVGAKESEVTRQASCAKAISNLNRSIHPQKKFPSTVFLSPRLHYFFFDSDWIFEPPFVDFAKSMSKEEGSSCIVISNFDRGIEAINPCQESYICGDTTPGDYQGVLSGAEPGSGWIYSMGRFGLTSDVGDWCIYCERGSEIGVAAFSRAVLSQSYLDLLKQIRAVTIDEAVRNPISHGFSNDALSTIWRNELLSNYPTQ